MKFFNRAVILIMLAVALALADRASGHGFAGARFFPATLSTDDPFVNDELSLPTVSTMKSPEGRETSIAGDIAKRITPNLGIELGEEFLDLNPKGEHEVSGFGNLELAAKYQFFVSAEHEANNQTTTNGTPNDRIPINPLTRRFALSERGSISAPARKVSTPAPNSARKLIHSVVA